MDLLNNLYVLVVKNKQFIPQSLLLVVGMIVKREKEETETDRQAYLGDNLPMNLIERIKGA